MQLTNQYQLRRYFALLVITITKNFVGCDLFTVQDILRRVAMILNGGRYVEEVVFFQNAGPSFTSDAINLLLIFYCL